MNITAPIAGVYVVFGNDRRVYVGESAGVLRRKTLSVSRSLGLDWSIVRYMPGSTGRQRSQMEHRIMAAYRAAGFLVVSKHKGESGGVRSGTEAHARRWSPERRQQHSELMRQRFGTPEWRAKQSERLKRYNAERTPEQRSVYGVKSWVTRRKNGTTGSGRAGKTNSVSHRAAISKALEGKPHSTAHREAIRAAMKRKQLPKGG